MRGVSSLTIAASGGTAQAASSQTGKPGQTGDGKPGQTGGQTGDSAKLPRFRKGQSRRLLQRATWRARVQIPP
jgi:hypothetical protein